MQKHGGLQKGGKATFKFNDKTYTVATKEELKRLVANGKKLQAMLKRTRRKPAVANEYTCMATESREESKGRSERQGQSIIQSSNRRDTESSRKRRTENSRTNQTEGKLPSTDGERERATDEGREEDPFETQFRGMGSLW